MASAASKAASSASSVAATDAGAEPLASSASEIASSASSLASSAASQASIDASSRAAEISSSVSDAAASASSGARDFADAAQAPLGLRALLAARKTGADRKQDSSNPNVPHEIIVRHTDDESALSVTTHPAEKVLEKEMQAKRWEDLDHKEKAGWKQRSVSFLILP